MPVLFKLIPDPGDHVKYLLCPALEGQRWVTQGRAELNWELLSGRKGFSGGAGGKEPTCQYRRCKSSRFSPWVGKIPWRRAWQPTPVFLPGESHGRGSLAGCSPRGGKEAWLKRPCTHARKHIGRVQGRGCNGCTAWIPPSGLRHTVPLERPGMLPAKSSELSPLQELPWPQVDNFTQGHAPSLRAAHIQGGWCERTKVQPPSSVQNNLKGRPSFWTLRMSWGPHQLLQSHCNLASPSAQPCFSDSFTGDDLGCPLHTYLDFCFPGCQPETGTMSVWLTAVPPVPSTGLCHNRSSRKYRLRGFLGGPMVNTRAFTAVNLGLIPGRGTKIPQAMWYRGKSFGWMNE